MVMFGTVNLGKAQTGTNVNGIISSDIAWIKVNSPYTLTGNVLVNSGATLTIEHGVAINFNGYYMLVNGTLVLNGNSNDLISLRGGALNLTSSASKWKEDGLGSIFSHISIYSTAINSAVSLRIDSVTTNATINLPNSSSVQNSIINADFSVGNSCTITGNQLTGKITAGNSSTISENTINGQLITGNSAIITKNILNGSISTGSAAITNNTIVGTITLKQPPAETSIISDNTLRGGGTVWAGVNFMPVWMYNYPVYPLSVIDIDGGQTTVSNNRIISQNLTSQIYGQIAPVSIYDGGYGITTQANSDTHILNNILTGGFYRGLDLAGSSIVEENNITGNIGGIAIGKICYDFGGSVSAGNKTIQNNIIASSKVSIDSFVRNNYDGWVDYGFVPQLYTVTIKGNLIVGGDSGIDLGTQTIIQNNTISNSKNAVTLRGTTDKIINYNNLQNYDSYGIYLNGTTTNVNATYNWWGTTNIATIDQSIYDYNDDFSLGTVTYTPILPTAVPSTWTFINSSINAGGSITPSGVIVLNRGDSQAFTVTPNTGYHVSDVLVNGTSVGAVIAYTVQNIGGATTISATFAPNPTPIPTANPTQSPTSQPTSNPTVMPTNNPTTNPSPTIPEFPTIILGLIIVPTIAITLFYKKKCNF